ncbi:MAG TPA: hypothetical protein VMH86_15605 [Rhizomicrobium sp.]|nr:hypothetical protein [Rhizomicrobium sp.]
MKVVALVAGVLLGGAAAAADDPAWTLYASGRYAEAEAAGEARGDAGGLSLAARANLALAAMRDGGCLDCLEHAEREARQAIARDPKYADAQVLLATALGYEGRIRGPIAARLNDYPGQAKTALDAALAADPRNCWALAGLGGWHIEVARAGGKHLAQWLYGASFEEGMRYFDRAFACAPGNLVFRYQYALSLSAYDLDRHRAGIADALKRARDLKPATAYETFAQARARELLALLGTGDDRAYLARVRRDQGYP